MTILELATMRMMATMAMISLKILLVARAQSCTLVGQGRDPRDVPQ